jgi:uncharacterized YccA/Bax inhibitor family protein
MKRTRSKKVVLVIAAATFAVAILTLGAAIWAVSVLGSAHLATPSLFATTFFFVCCSIVLYVMSLMPGQLPPEGDGADS